MDYKIEEFDLKMLDCYFGNYNYDYHNDPDLTFQEFFLIYQTEMCMKNEYCNFGIELFNPDDYKVLPLEEWYDSCIAQFYQEIKIDKPWDQVFVKRNIINNIILNDFGNPISFWNLSPYKEICEYRNKTYIEYIEKKNKEYLKRKEYYKKRHEQMKQEKEAKK